MTDTTQQQAVIYTRCAIKNDHGSRADQEKRCSDYAAMKGFQIIETFTDYGSGNVADRPGFREMLGFLAAQDAAPPVVLIDEIFRLSRNVAVLGELRDAINFTGSRIVSTSIQGDAP